MKNIIAFSASNSSNSINRHLLTIACEYLNEHQLTSVDIRDYPMPMYSVDIEQESGYPDSAKSLKEVFSNADAFLIATPEHNGSMPAVFKNTIDWLSRMANKENPIFGNKPLLLLSTSPGPNGGKTNIQTLKQLMPWWGADVKDSYSLGSYHKHVTEESLEQTEAARLETLIKTFLQNL